MNKFFIALFLFFTISFMSCKPIISTIMDINKYKTFENKAAYQTYVNKKYGINSNDLYYASEKSKIKLIKYLQAHNIATFYGIFINHTNRYQFSEFLNDNKGCYGRILKEIASDSLNIITDNLYEDVEILNINSNNRFIPSNNKKTITFIFTTNFGNVYKNDFKKYLKQYNDTTKYQFIFISLDDIASLN